MPSASRSRVRALAAVGMAAVVVTVGAVTFQASAAVSADAHTVKIPPIPGGST